MTTPVKAELLQALSDLRHAAEGLKTYDADAADRLNAAIARHGAPVRAMFGLAGETGSIHKRLVGHMAAVVECVERARKYPSQITARADLLDRASGLAKMARLLLDKLAPSPPR